MCIIIQRCIYMLIDTQVVDITRLSIYIRRKSSSPVTYYIILLNTVLLVFIIPVVTTNIHIIINPYI